MGGWGDMARLVWLIWGGHFNMIKGLTELCSNQHWPPAQTGERRGPLKRRRGPLLRDVPVENFSRQVTTTREDPTARRCYPTLHHVVGEGTTANADMVSSLFVFRL